MVGPSSIHDRAVQARQKPGMSVETFEEYWREHHGPLACKAPGLRRYVQDHPLMRLYGGRDEPLCDGVAEAWFDSLADLERSTQTGGSRRCARTNPTSWISTSWSLS